MNDTTVRGNVVAGLEQDHVAGHQALGGRPLRHTVAQRRHFVRQQLLKGEECRLGAVLLPEGKQSIHDNDGDDGHAERPHALSWLTRIRQEGEHPRDPQDDREEVRELPQEPH